MAKAYKEIDIGHGKVTFELREDGWWYTNTGHRCHLRHYPNSNYVDEVMDLEKLCDHQKNG